MDEATQSGAITAETLALRRLASSVLCRALDDARAGDPYAVTWLGSRAAEIWFDFLDFPQSTVLLRSGWLDMAEEVLPHAPESLYIPILTTRTYLLDLQASTRPST